MISSQRNRLSSMIMSERVARSGYLSASIVLSVIAAGCSADVTRLDGPSFGLSDNSAAQAAPRPSESVGRRNAGGPMDNGSWPSSGPREGDTPASRSALPPPPSSNSAANAQAQKFASLPEPAAGSPAAVTRPYPAAAPAAAARPSAPVKTASLTPPRTATATGETIEVVQGDSLFGLSKRHGVSMAALMEVNGLTSTNLKPGQKLVLPLVSGARKPMARGTAQAAPPAPVATKPSSAAPVPAAVPSPPPPVVAAAPAPAPSDWTGSYTLKSGDSVYGIARQHHVSATELQRVNGITDPAKMRPGTVLKVPATSGAAVASAAPAPAAVASAPNEPVAVTQGAGTAASPKIIGGATPVQVESKVASLNGVAPASEAAPGVPAAEAAPQSKAVKTAAVATAAAAANGAAAKFRWPVKGKVISEFGKRADGTHNDGINVAVPAGTDIQAAESGTVAYAGSELKGYGNLILVRHDNGWVSAYAHSDSVLVKRGDAVKRGQVIAKAGKTGTVDQPQVHFELRQGSKPVDPMPHMDKQ
jgi:murein DD-endopeptidase MepM/ murein hydrolase activator NlpD